MKRIVLSVLLVTSIILMVFSGVGVFKEGEITEGYKIYENVKASSANNGGINLSEKQAFDLTSYISNGLINVWRLHALNLLFSTFVFVVLLWQLISERKNT
jgi:hypothetical protein